MASTIPAKKTGKAPTPKLTQTQIFRVLAESSELPNEQVASLFKQPAQARLCPAL